MEFILYSVILIRIFSLAHGNRSVRKSCQIPVEAENLRMKFSLVYHSDRLAYKDGSDVFDGDWNFLPGARVLHGMRSRVSCAKDVYGDAIHKTYKAKCINGRWSPKLPKCTDYCRAPVAPGMIMVSGMRLGELYRSGCSASYDCGPGWYTVGSGSLVCERGVWLDKELTCAKYPAPVGLNVVNVNAAVVNGSDVRVSWELENAEEESIRYFRVLNTRSYTDPPELWNSTKVPNDTFTTTLQHVTHGVNKVGVAAGNGIGEGPLSDVVWLFVRRHVTESWHIDVSGEPEESAYNEYEYYRNENDSLETSTNNGSTASRVDAPLPSCPENVTTDIHGNDITITWDIATSTPVRVHGHIIEYKTAPGSWRQSEYIMAPNSSYDLVGLGYGQNYNIRAVSLGIEELNICDEVNVTIDFAPCSFASIPDVGIPDTMHDDLTSLPHGHAITFSCADNKHLQGNSTVVCNNGNWSDVRFTCIRYKSCRRVNNSRLIMKPFKNVYTHGSKVRLTCRRWRRIGRRLLGRRNRRKLFAKCNDGTWSKKLRKMCTRRRILS